LSEKAVLPLQPAVCAIGVITKVFGIKGEVKLHSYSRSAEEMDDLKTILIGRETHATRLMTLEKVTVRGTDLYLKFETINDRSAAELLVGHFLFIDEKDRKRLPEGRYFVDDLIGARVEGEDGIELGRIKDVMATTAHGLFVVRTPHGEILVPNVPEIVKRVDLVEHRVVIIPPTGMFGGAEA
jgi:16S rRNA processing protein RimM